jgi:hypothetical protein
MVAVDAAPINPADFLLAAGWFGVQPTSPDGSHRLSAVSP